MSPTENHYLTLACVQLDIPTTSILAFASHDDIFVVVLKSGQKYSFTKNELDNPSSLPPSARSLGIVEISPDTRSLGIEISPVPQPPSGGQPPLGDQPPLEDRPTDYPLPLRNRGRPRLIKSDPS